MNRHAKVKKIKIVTTYLLNEPSWKGRALRTRTLPGYPVHTPFHRAGGGASLPSRVLRIKLIGSCSTLGVAPQEGPLSSL